MKLFKKTNPLLLFIMVSLFLTSCGSEDNNSAISGNCDLAALQTASDVVSNKALEFASNQTETNCNAYKTAMRNFINIADNCPDVPQSEIDQLNSFLSEVDCSDL